MWELEQLASFTALCCVSVVCMLVFLLTFGDVWPPHTHTVIPFRLLKINIYQFQLHCLHSIVSIFVVRAYECVAVVKPIGKYSDEIWMDGEREKRKHIRVQRVSVLCVCGERERANALHGIKNTVDKQWSTMNILCFLFRNNIEWMVTIILFFTYHG